MFSNPYPEITLPDFFKKINEKKEILYLKPQKKNNAAACNCSLKFDEHDKLIYKNHQLFLQHFMSPYTQYKRLYVKHMPGAGKTIGSLGVVMNFYDIFKQMHKHDRTFEKTIYVIGFTKQIFQKELLRFPEFGFVNEHDLVYLKELEVLAKHGTKEDQKNYDNFKISLKKRLTKKRVMGFFKFVGYKALFNKLFKIDDPEITIKKEKDIYNYMKDGVIKINEELLDSFSNSIIICDEIQNVYNSEEKNNYGIALQIIVNEYEKKENEELRVLYLSATPINNRPSEFIDLLNLLIPAKELNFSLLKKKDFFKNKGHDLLPGALDKFKSLLKGRVSFYKDVNPVLFPSSEIIGERIPKIEFLKFIRCEMTKAHYDTYKKNYSGSLTNDEYSILDFVLPNPKDEKTFIYKSSEIRSFIPFASQEWKNKYGLKYVEVRGIAKLVGPFFNAESLKKYSSKYYTMITNLISLMKGNTGKIMIYHPYVHIFGTLFIEEILLNNGFIKENDAPNDFTYCIICGIIKKNHEKSDHEFIPARFMSINSDINKTERTKKIEAFNLPNNDYGSQCKIIIGSKVIQESIDFKSIRFIFFMHLVTNIPNFIQIKGRAIRMNSHARLLEQDRNVKIYVYVSSVPGKETLAYEEEKYREKSNYYKTIQKIERIINMEAVDSYINRENIFPEDYIKYIGTQKHDTYHLDDLYFEPPKVNIEKIKTDTFNAFYNQDELNNISYIIKKLFLECSHVWTYDDLFNAVKNCGRNTYLVDERRFIVVLTELTWTSIDREYEKILKKNKSYIDQLFDYSQKNLFDNNDNEFKITKVGKYYMLIPVLKEKEAVGDMINTVAIPIIDVEQWNRNEKIVGIDKINITSYLSNLEYSFDIIKENFINQFSNMKIAKLSEAIATYSQEFHIQLIKYIIKYFFLLLIGINTNRSEHHLFYVKLLYFYDKNNLVLFADQIASNKSLRKKYEKYVNFDKEIEKESGYNRFLMSTLKKSLSKYTENIHITRFNEYLKKKKKIIPASMLPIGHLLNKYDKIEIFLPEHDWIDTNEVITEPTKNLVENDIIIGYLEKSKTNIEVKFKLRPPLHKIKMHKDTRKNIRGNTCNTIKKKNLLEICKQLDIDVTKTKTNTNNLCEEIKNTLMGLELISRRKYYKLTEKEKKEKKRIKWFYLHLEEQPCI
jgi:hypothetical protein